MQNRSPLPDYFTIPRDARPIGYTALVERHRLRTLPHHRWSFLARKGERRELDRGRYVLRLPSYEPESMTDVDHLLFSLKHDGPSLPILAELFATVDPKRFERELKKTIEARPVGVYHRRLWYLYEWLTGRTVATNVASTASYVPLLDPDDYFTGRDVKHPRYRVIDNLPGNRDFCPLVRKTDQLSRRTPAALRARIDQVIGKYDDELLSRALAFIYTKETRSSFAIEHEQPTASRAERFANLLKRAGDLGELDEHVLTELQNRVVDPRFAEDGYRELQNYVGESVGLHRQIVHFVPPKPADVRSLMGGLVRAVAEHSGHVRDAIVWAAAISFGFVFVHPFADGNGRLHRFLIHYLHAREQFTPAGVIVPVSAVMLAKRHEYDACLEKFSRPLMELVDYDLDEAGFLSVSNDTARYYRYFDATPMAEALYAWLDTAIDVELRDELAFLYGLRQAKADMQKIVDMPDRLADLFVKIVVSNRGTLSKRKREQFSMLTDDEVKALEAAVRTHLPSRAADR